MLSRDTRAHGAAVLVAIGVLVVASAANVPTDGGPAIALAVLVYGIALGGAHLFLALRGDDGLIPAESRWRYVTALGIVLLSAAVIALAGDRSVGPATVEQIAIAAIICTTVGYVLLESSAGYRAVRS